MTEPLRNDSQRATFTAYAIGLLIDSERKFRVAIRSCLVFASEASCARREAEDDASAALNVDPSMQNIDPFEFLKPGVRLSMDIGEGAALACVVRRVEPAQHLVYVGVDSEESAAMAVTFVDWRVYLLTTEDSRGCSHESSVVVPTEVRRVTDRPWSAELEVLDGTLVRQRRTSYRARRPGLQARVRAEGTANDTQGEVFNLSKGGLLLITSDAPPPGGTELAVEILVPGGEPLPIRARLLGANEGMGAHSNWRWRVEFHAVLEPLRSALLLQVHRDEP